MITDDQSKISVSKELIHDFQYHGVVCLRGLLSTDEVTILREGIEHNLASLSWRAKVASRPEDPGHFVEDFCTWQSNPYYTLNSDKILIVLAK